MEHADAKVARQATTTQRLLDGADAGRNTASTYATVWRVTWGTAFRAWQLRRSANRRWGPAGCSKWKLL
eukprot:12889422-Prorocentrum_lima.AAC.1